MDNKKKTVQIGVFAFMVPFLIMGAAFAKLKIYPFGDQQVLVIDAWHQYYPFLVELSRKLKDGESLLYSWRLGLGSDFTALAAYTLASPLNLPAAFLPGSWLREAFALMILIKIGAAGSFCALALCKINRYGEEEREDRPEFYGILIFSTFYALCGWAQGYYWNSMWLDSFAVFPLAALGACRLVKEKKRGLYTISLAAAILFNFYIGMLICIFMVFFFPVQCIARQEGFKGLWRDLKNIVLCSGISFMISAAFTLPAFVVLQNAHKGTGFPEKLTVTRGWIETISGMFAYLETSPLNVDEMPHIYCGVLCLLLLFAFFRLPAVSGKEKAAYLAITLFMLISMNLNVLEYLWHGFRYTHGLPYRFSFMFSFLIVLMAHRAYMDLDMLKKKDCFITGASGILCYLLAAADQIYRYGKENNCGSVFEILYKGNDLREFLFKNLLVIAAYLVLLALMVKKKRKRKWFTLLLMYVAGLELVSTVMTRNNAEWTTQRDNYPERYEAVQAALADLEKREGKESFYRTEFASRPVLNPSVLYGYRGVTFFSSTTNAAVTEAFQNMGLPQWDNGYYYQNTTPVDNLFLNLKYLIAGGDEEIANPEYLTEIMQAEDVCVYQNEAYLPIGFMVESGMADFRFEGITPFEKQNSLIKAAAGVEGDVFEGMDVACADYENVDMTRYDYGLYGYEPLEKMDETGKGKADRGEEEPENEKFRYTYEMPKDGSVYVFMDLKRKETAENTVVTEGNGKTGTYVIYSGGNFFPAGTYKEGERFSVCSETDSGESGDLYLFAGILNQDVFDQAYDLLKDETLTVTEWTSKYLRGNITVKKDNLLFTSIPCDRGWKVYVDGERADIIPVAGAFMGVMLPEGEHTVEFLYSPIQVYLGGILSLLGIGIFLWIFILDRKGKRKGIEF